MSDENVNAGAQADTGTPAGENSAPPAAPENGGAPPAAETPLMGEPKPAEAKPAEAAPIMGDGKPAETEGGDGEPAEPTDYLGGLKLPEGYAVDPELAPKANELFGKYKLPKEAAQEFVDLMLETRKQEAASAAAKQGDAIGAMRREIEGRPKFAEELPVVKLGIENLAKDFPRVRELYNDPVFGNMPELWEIALAVGRRFETEGHLLSGGRDTGARGDFLTGIYNKMEENK